jgi:hypothetical protein
MMVFSLSTTSPKDGATTVHDEAQVPSLSPLQLLRGLRPRKRLETLAERVRNTMRVGNYWYWLEAPDLAKGIEIAKLICPLRYDVLVRRDFHSFHSLHRDLYRSDFDSFVELARQSSYYTWFVASEVVRWGLHRSYDPDRLSTQFVHKVRKAVMLYESMEANGFDKRNPIVLKTAEQLLPPTADRSAPPTGKVVSDRYFLADGCHRVAWLMSKGYTVLPAGFFRVRCFREFSPFDSTSLLAPSLPIPASEYFAFLSSRYCHPLVFEDEAGFLGHVETHRPELLDEVLSLIRVDGFDASDS